MIFFLTPSYISLISIQPYHSPEYSFIFVPNPFQNVMHILYPTNTSTYVLDLLLDNPIQAAFYPKNTNLTYGMDKNASNYWAVMPVSTGVAFLDMHKVVLAFERKQYLMTSKNVNIVPYSTGNSSRVIVMGGDYLISETYTSTLDGDDDNPTSGDPSGVVIINARTQTVHRTLTDVAVGAREFLWVPIHTDELSYQVGLLSAEISSLTAMVASLNSQVSSLNSNQKDYHAAKRTATDGVVLGAISLVISLVLATVVLYAIISLRSIAASKGQRVNLHSEGSAGEAGGTV